MELDGWENYVGGSVLLLILLIILPLGTAANYTISVHEGIGAGTGDTQQHIPPDDDPTPYTPVRYKIKIKNSISFQDSIGEKPKPMLINEGISFSEKTATSDTAKEIIDYTPYIIWGAIILLIIIIIGVGWYFYDIYSY